tara:strand:+ start:333 stop:911 length:579 start_codon:yes stop_codon:yes gene_type:complete
MDTSYENGKIYKIIDNTNGNFYVGSTNYIKLCSRLGKHRGYLKAYLNGSSLNYCTSMEILINENYKILLLEPYPCKNRDELRMREQEWMDKLRCDKMVNKHNAYISKEDMSINQKKYQEEHKEEISIKKKQYRINNPELSKEQDRAKYQRNKENRLARQRERIDCPNCKKNVRRGDIARHMKTQRCLDFVEK